MIFVKNFRGGREVNMINTVSKMNLSKKGWEGGGGQPQFGYVFIYTGFFLDVTPNAPSDGGVLCILYSLHDILSI